VAAVAFSVLPGGSSDDVRGKGGIPQADDLRVESRLSVEGIDILLQVA